MNLLPNTSDTVGNWGFQNTLADSSGNGLDMAVSVGSEIYDDCAPGLRGFRLDQGGPSYGGKNCLSARLPPLLQLATEMTLQAIWLPRKTTSNSIFACSQGPNPGSSVYQAYVSGGSVFDWRDLVISSLSTANDMIPVVNIVNYVNVVFPAVAGTPYLFTWRRRRTTGSAYIAELFINGTLMASVVTGASPPTGTERLLLGNFYQGQAAGCSGVIASVRVMASARP